MMARWRADRRNLDPRRTVHVVPSVPTVRGGYSCPHRKVPLSEGRVEDDGTLLCSYHAWRWTGDADLCSVPQAQSEDEFARIQSNPKSKCNSFPAKVVNGVLWVWPESGDDARLESALSEVPMMKLPHELDDSIDEDRLFCGTWNFRELPYSHDSLLIRFSRSPNMDSRSV